MAETLVASAISTLGGFLKTEVGFLLGVEDQVQNMERELIWMLSYLHQADLRQDEDKIVRQCVAEVRDAVYDAEDVVETFALQIASRRNANVLERSAGMFTQGKNLYEVGLKIKAINDGLKDLNERLQRFTVPLRQGEITTSWFDKQRELRRSYPHIREQNVVGLEGNIKELVTNLVAQDKQFVVLSIYGMGGIGKTTLAKKIFDHGEVRRHFDYFAWAYVSQKCRTREIWQGILFNLTTLTEKQTNEVIRMTDEQLAPKLYQFLKEKKCLVILDDIWNISDWKALSAAFPKEETGTKILLTSRNKELALLADRRGFHHEVQCLNGELSRQLLCKIAYMERNDADFVSNVKMEEEAEVMVKYCAGLPLAITVLGGILATKNSINEWQKVHEHIKLHLRGGEEYIGIKDVLALSYNDLPTQLRSCFLHLSQFPEDSEINVDKLIRMWVAEGFTKLVQHGREENEEEESMEYVADRFLNELILRCMVLVGDRGNNLEVKTCRMHDLMRDLCLLKAKEENFTDFIDRSHNNCKEYISSSSTGKLRRLAVNLHGEGCQFPLKCIKNPHLRSLLCFYDFSFKRWSLESPAFETLKLLRLLDLDGAEFRGGKLPKAIGKLIHLKFLSLRDAEVFKLPPSLGNLSCLQTLDLLIADKVVHIPNVIWKLENLRHLYLPVDCDNKTKLQLRNLKKLRTLINFPAGNCNVEDLYTLINIRELSIRRSFLIKDFREVSAHLRTTLKHMHSFSLANYEKLDVKQLVTGCGNLNELRLHVQIDELPRFDQFPQGITYISLRSCKLKEDPMATFEKLLNLRVLELDEDSFIGKEIICSKVGFPKLHSLSLRSLKQLELWRVEESAMTNLFRLEIMCCQQLKMIPEEMKFLKNLEEMEIKRMPKSFKEKLIYGGEDFYKVKHVSSLLFQHCN
ncbi:hypothetical protein ACFE04_006800 [Oxalis oulophora]